MKTRETGISGIGVGRAVDRTLHHTIDSLISSLVADLRLPRVISTEGPFRIVLHKECQKEASKLGFPIINPLPDMTWGKAKTEALTSLHRQLSRRELAIKDWEGPESRPLEEVITRLENRLRGTHPDMVPQRIIECLNEEKRHSHSRTLMELSC